MNKLPKNWILTTIGKVGIVVSGGTPSTKKSEYWEGGNISWITPADLSKYNEKNISKGKRNITQEGLDYSSAKLLPKGTVLFSSRAPIGYTVIAKNELATNQGFKNLITTKSLSSDYVYYYFKTLKKSAEEVASGTTFLELSATKFSKLPFPLAPLEEQKKIVLKIEELFSVLFEIELLLQKTRKLLINYRLSILNNAFKGKLIKKSSDVDEYRNWKNIKFKDFCQLQRGYDLPLSTIELGDYPVVTSSGIKGYHKEYRHKGPCLITGRSGNVGKVYYKDVNHYWPHNTVLFVKDFYENYPKFVYYYFLGIDFKKYSSGTAVPTLDRKNLNNINIRVPTIDTQKNIVQSIEYHFSMISNLEKIVDNSFEKIILLRKKILDNAFKGKLVDNIIDESAKDLLKQIQSEKLEYLKQEKKIQKKRVKKGRTMSSTTPTK